MSEYFSDGENTDLSEVLDGGEEPVIDEQEDVQVFVYVGDDLKSLCRDLSDFLEADYRVAFSSNNGLLNERLFDEVEEMRPEDGFLEDGQSYERLSRFADVVLAGPDREVWYHAKNFHEYSPGDLDIEKRVRMKESGPDYSVPFRFFASIGNYVEKGINKSLERFSG